MRTLIVSLLLVLAGCSRTVPSLPANALDISWRFEETGADFRLNDATGKTRSLAEFRGKVVVLFFGYTHCPEVCPTTLATLARVMRTLGPAAQDVPGLFVTVDP